MGCAFATAGVAIGCLLRAVIGAVLTAAFVIALIVYAVSHSKVHAYPSAVGITVVNDWDKPLTGLKFTVQAVNRANPSAPKAYFYLSMPQIAPHSQSYAAFTSFKATTGHALNPSRFGPERYDIAYNGPDGPQDAYGNL